MAIRSLTLLLALSTLAACAPSAEDATEVDEGPRIVQPGAPGEETRVLSADDLAALPGVTHTPADVRFMQGMIPHHAQAIDMVDLMDGRTSSELMVSLGERITISQTDEIESMQRWLTARGEEPPADGAAHMHMDGAAPGMLTPEQMAELAAAEGVEFDRLFLRYMISHHQGALVMVGELMASPGAAQESEVFAFASDVEADQKMEIERMNEMLKELDR
jgi:uncharacterized protein (DUF305 family)